MCGSLCIRQRCTVAARTVNTRRAARHRCRCTISPRGCFTSSIDCSAQVNGVAGGCPRNTAPTLLHVTLPQLSSRPRRGRVAACADGGDWRVSCSVALTRHPVPRSPARVYRACCNSAARPDAHKPHTSQPPLLPYGGLRCCRAAYWPTIKSQRVQPPPPPHPQSPLTPPSRLMQWMALLAHPLLLIFGTSQSRTRSVRDAAAHTSAVE